VEIVGDMVPEANLMDKYWVKERAGETRSMWREGQQPRNFVAYMEARERLKRCKGGKAVLAMEERRRLVGPNFQNLR
jgi:hypothetical protein